MGIIIVLVFLGAMLVGMPITVSLGISSVIGFMGLGMPMSFVAQTAFTAVDDFTIIAVPMFILAGALMDRGGITLGLINIAKNIVGNKAGGLAVVTIVACTLFGSISGSGLATCAAIGAICIPMMIREGYSKDFSAAVSACGGGVGAVLPPSILMIIYGVSAEASITGLFIAGIIPGIMLSIAMCTAAIVVSIRKGFRTEAPKSSFTELRKSLWESRWAMLTPVLILGGIYTGIFTVTEASVVAALYAFLVVAFIYKALTWEILLDSLAGTVRTAGSVLLIVTTGRMFGRMITLYHFPQAISEMLVTYISSPTVMIMLIILLLLFIGMWMEANTLIIILTPILLPVVVKIGIHPIQFGLILVIACEIGFETPPVGINLFVASDLAGTSIEKISRQVIPFVIAETCVLTLISLIPGITLFLPRLMGLIK